jgi:replicative DNA helicase
MKDAELERDVLAMFLNSYEAQMHISECNEHFFTDPQNKAAFQSIKQLSDKGEPIDVMTVGLKLKKMGLPMHTAVHISARYIGDANLQFKVKILHQMHLTRQLSVLAAEMQHHAADRNADPFAIISNAQARLDQLSVIDSSDGVHIARVAVDRVNDIAQRKREGIKTLGVPSGWETLDRFTGGFVPGEFWVVAGRPGMGKTSWANSISIAHSLRAGGKVAFFSLEMTKEGLVDRVLSSEYSINGEAIRTANVSEEQIEQMARLANIARMNIWIDDSRRQTIDQIRSKLKMMKAKHGITLAIIDYLGLINPSDPKTIREQQVAYISRQCKLIAGESKLTVIALSQLNRQSEQRNDKRPGLADLRESGAIEQDADVVVFPFRPMYYETEKTPVEEAETIISKNRNGRTGIIPCQFVSAHSHYLL